MASRDPTRWVNLNEVQAFNKMRVLMRDLDQNEFVEALKRQEKNFKNCSFDLSEDGTRVRKRGLKIIEKPAQKKQTAAAVEPKV